MNVSAVAERKGRLLIKKDGPENSFTDMVDVVFAAGKI